MPKHWIAIAAMAENRVIGNDNRLPWHLPEDFKFFKQQTMGHVLVMGRKTFASIGKPLPGRDTIVLSRNSQPINGVRIMRSIEELITFQSDKTLYICGGANIYEQLLPYCSELLLTRVKLRPQGDAFFPEFESLFSLDTVVLETDAFTIERHKRMKS